MQSPMASSTNSRFREFDYVVETSEPFDTRSKSVMFPCTPDYRRMASLESPRRPSVIKSIFQHTTQEEMEDLSHTHSYVYIMLHPKSRSPQAEMFKKVITTIIFLDLLAFILSTEPTLQETYTIWFLVFEGIFSIIFLVEYAARVITVTEDTRYAEHGPIFGRLAWMIKFRAIIDFLATIPFFIQLATGWAIPHLSYLRVFRVLRICRTDGYIRAFNACYRVVYYNREVLWVAVLVCLFLIMVSSILLYFLRPRNDYAEAQFKSIPSTIYLSVLMLTGQDSWIRGSENMPWYTKLMVGITGGLSVAMFAIPVSLLTWGFEAEAERCAKKARREFKRQKSSGAESVISEQQQWQQQQQQGPILRVSTTTSDEEYQRIIAKESSDSGALDEQFKQDHLKDLVEKFLHGDHDSHKFYALTGFLTNQNQRANHVSFPSSDEYQDATARDVHMLQRRMDYLESVVGGMDSKLDRLCSLLEQQPRTPSGELT